MSSSDSEDADTTSCPLDSESSPSGDKQTQSRFAGVKALNFVAGSERNLISLGQNDECPLYIWTGNDAGNLTFWDFGYICNATVDKYRRRTETSFKHVSRVVNHINRVNTDVHPLTLQLPSPNLEPPVFAKTDAAQKSSVFDEFRNAGDKVKVLTYGQHAYQVPGKSCFLTYVEDYEGLAESDGHLVQFCHDVASYDTARTSPIISNSFARRYRVLPTDKKKQVILFTHPRQEWPDDLESSAFVPQGVDGLVMAILQNVDSASDKRAAGNFYSIDEQGDESRPEGSVRMPTRNLHLMERPISKDEQEDVEEVDTDAPESLDWSASGTPSPYRDQHLIPTHQLPPDTISTPAGSPSRIKMDYTPSPQASALPANVPDGKVQEWRNYSWAQRARIQACRKQAASLIIVDPKWNEFVCGSEGGVLHPHLEEPDRNQPLIAFHPQITGRGAFIWTLPGSLSQLAGISLTRRAKDLLFVDLQSRYHEREDFNFKRGTLDVGMSKQERERILRIETHDPVRRRRGIRNDMPVLSYEVAARRRDFAEIINSYPHRSADRVEGVGIFDPEKQEEYPPYRVPEENCWIAYLSYDPARNGNEMDDFLKFVWNQVWEPEVGDAKGRNKPENQHRPTVRYYNARNKTEDFEKHIVLFTMANIDDLWPLEYPRAFPDDATLDPNTYDSKVGDAVVFARMVMVPKVLLGSRYQEKVERVLRDDQIFYSLESQQDYLLPRRKTEDELEFARIRAASAEACAYVKDKCQGFVVGSEQNICAKAVKGYDKKTDIPSFCWTGGYLPSNPAKQPLVHQLGKRYNTVQFFDLQNLLSMPQYARRKGESTEYYQLRLFDDAGFLAALRGQGLGLDADAKIPYEDIRLQLLDLLQYGFGMYYQYDPSEKQDWGGISVWDSRRPRVFNAETSDWYLAWIKYNEGDGPKARKDEEPEPGGVGRRPRNELATFCQEIYQRTFRGVDRPGFTKQVVLFTLANTYPGWAKQFPYAPRDKETRALQADALAMACVRWVAKGEDGKPLQMREFYTLKEQEETLAPLDVVEFSDSDGDDDDDDDDDDSGDNPQFSFVQDATGRPEMTENLVRGGDKGKGAQKRRAPSSESGSQGHSSQGSPPSTQGGAGPSRRWRIRRRRLD